VFHIPIVQHMFGWLAGIHLQAPGLMRTFARYAWGYVSGDVEVREILLMLQPYAK